MSLQAHSLKLTILQTSDLHGSIMPIHYADNGPDEVGLAKIAVLIRRERARCEHVMLIDNGDLIQGTPLVYHHARTDNRPVHPMIKVMNALSFDACVVGNHEFNYGPDILMKAVNESEFPWLSANIVGKSTKEPWFGPPYLIRTFPGGLRVGILGLTTHYIPNWENPAYIREIDFLDAVETAKRYVAELRKEQQVDVLIVSYHGGFERDLETGELTEKLTGENQGYRLCAEIPGIDVLLTGHQHRKIAGKSVNGVCVVQPGAHGNRLGKVTISLQKQAGRWTITDKYSELLSVEGVEPDPEVLALAGEYERKTQIWLDTPIGKLEGNMRIDDPMAVRMKDHPFIEFVNKVQMHYGKVEISNTALFDNRSRGFSGDVTVRDVVANYVYPNTLKVIRVTGQDIKDALEQSASYFAWDENGKIGVSEFFRSPKPQHYNYDMWEGIDYRIDVSRPVGERVTRLRFKGEPLAMDREYEVVMNNYRAGGGGNYFMFRNKPVVREVPTEVSELIADYILERGTITATVDHNWVVVTSPQSRY